MLVKTTYSIVSKNMYSMEVVSKPLPQQWIWLDQHICQYKCKLVSWHTSGEWPSFIIYIVVLTGQYRRTHSYSNCHVGVDWNNLVLYVNTAQLYVWVCEFYLYIIFFRYPAAFRRLFRRLSGKNVFKIMTQRSPLVQRIRTRWIKEKNNSNFAR